MAFRQWHVNNTLCTIFLHLFQPLHFHLWFPLLIVFPLYITTLQHPHPISPPSHYRLFLCPLHFHSLMVMFFNQLQCWLTNWLILITKPINLGDQPLAFPFSFPFCEPLNLHFLYHFLLLINVHRCHPCSDFQPLLLYLHQTTSLASKFVGQAIHELSWTSK